MIKFGTGGWRAIIADGFTKENIRLLTAGLCALMEKEGHAGAEICVGYDRRFLSKESAHWACEVLAGYGFRPYVINRSSPTPLIMFTVKRRNMPYGMAVTASHNPAIYNGIKVFTEGGRDADAEVTRRIEAEIEKLSPADVKSVDYDTALAEGAAVSAAFRAGKCGRGVVMYALCAGENDRSTGDVFVNDGKDELSVANFLADLR